MKIVIVAEGARRSGLTEWARFPMMKISRWSWVVRRWLLVHLAGFWPTTQDQRPTTKRPTTSLMRIAYLDCFSGMSGDMFLGALVDAGVPPQLLEETVAALNIGARLEISRVQRNSISAIKVDVYSNGEKDLPREIWEQQEEQSGHAHPGPDDTAHPHLHDHGHDEHWALSRSSAGTGCAVGTQLRLAKPR